MYKVLLTDDEIYVRQGLKQLIPWEKYGFEVCGEAADGEEALRLVEKIRFDLVITDIRMPVLDGLELIRSVAESTLPTPSFIILSGYNDFKYAQQAIRYGVCDYLLKPIDEDELQEILLKLAADLQEKQEREAVMDEWKLKELLENWLQGQTTAEESKLVLERLGMRQQHPFYWVIAEVNRTPETVKGGDSFGQEKSVLQRTFAQWAGLPVYLVEMGKDRYGFILSAELLARQNGTIRSCAESLQQQLTVSLQKPVYLYVGEKAVSADRLQESIATAGQSIPFKYIQSLGSVILYEDIKNSPIQYADANPKLYATLLEQIEENDRAGIRDTADLLFEDFQANHLALDAVKTALHHCVLAVLRLIQSMGEHSEGLRDLEMFLDFYYYPILLPDLKRFFTDAMLLGAHVLAELGKKNMKGSIHKIKQYIEEHFRENINLKSISSAFYLNPVYLGQLFKKTYGVYFKDFLLDLRVQEAKKMLRQTDKKVYEIAESVGFSNADYFVTQFEKMERISPTEYRNQLMNK